jgi:ATP-dependent Clp protease ATP-binding subunit ClpA
MADINRMTHKLQEGLQQASAIATRRNHQGIDVEHLLVALLDQEGASPRASSRWRASRRGASATRSRRSWTGAPR